MDKLTKLQADIPAENKAVRVICLVELAKISIQLEKVDQAIEFANEAVSLGNKQARLRMNFACKIAYSSVYQRFRPRSYHQKAQ